MSLEAAQVSLGQLEKRWGLSPLKESYQHKAEGLQLISEGKSKRLEVRVWYEDPSVTQNRLPDRGLYCRLMHSFVYGRSVLRSKATELPPDLAFSSFPKLSEIRFIFFALKYSNQPTSPYWDKRPDPPPASIDPDAKLRVQWIRQEEIIPYLSLSVGRQEWNSVSSKLQGRPYYSYSEFVREVCEDLYRLLPNLRSNLAALEPTDAKR